MKIREAIYSKFEQALEDGVDIENLDEFGLMIAEVNTKLAKFCSGPIEPRATEFDIFPEGKSGSGGGDFVFSHIKTMEEAASLVDILTASASQNERWPYQQWVEDSVKKGEIVIAVSDYDGGGPVGYVAFSMNLHADTYGPDVDLVLSINTSSVYIKPDEREKGFSEALSWAVGTHMIGVFDELRKATKSELESIDGLPIDIYLTGEAHSPGGARFLSRIVNEIESNVALCGIDTNWKPGVEVSDDIDFSDFPDCGFGPKHRKSNKTVSPRL